MDPADKGQATAPKWREVLEAVRDLADADSEDDSAYDRAELRLRAVAGAYFRRNLPPSSG